MSHATRGRAGNTLGFGLTSAGASAFAGSADPMVELTGRYAGHTMAVILAAGATVSAFAAAFGSTVAGSRVLFTFGRDGLLPARFRATNASGAPAAAIIASVLIPAAACVAWFIYGTTAVNMFGDFGTIGVLALLLAYLATQVAALRLFAGREWRGARLAVPVIAIGLLGYTLYANVYPAPPAPGLYFPYLVILWLVLGFIVTLLKPNEIRRVASELGGTDGAAAALATNKTEPPS